MEENINKSIFETLYSLNEEAKRISIQESEKRKFVAWSIKVARELVKLFGRDSTQYKIYRNLFSELKPSSKLSVALLKERIENLDSLVNSLVRYVDSEHISNISYPSKIPATKNVFIIHGHDELNTLKLKNLLSDDFHLSPIVIANKPGQSRSIIDKFEIDASTCSFAFALFTKDDEVKNSNNIYYQARPNVIFESGWFTGRLSKQRIVLLLQNGTKIHSDLDGISRIQFQSDIKEKYKEIKDELEAANMM